METKNKFIYLLAFGLVIFLSSCSKGGHSNVMVKMTDAPADFQEVNVEVIGAQIHYEDEGEGSNGWVSLPVRRDIYNLLELQDIAIVLCDQKSVPSGKVTQMRLLLGSQNSLMIDSLMVPLATPSGLQTGLKFNLDFVFKKDRTYAVLIDFDASLSIVLQGNGSYALKPVIKVESVDEL